MGGLSEFFLRLAVDKTSVESVKLGKSLKSSKIMKIMLDRVHWGHRQIFLDPLIFVRKANIPNLRLLIPFLHVKKFVVVSGGC